MSFLRYLPACALLALTACGGDVKETLGMNRKAPDEFRVVSRPPLSVPPQFNLRPPSITDSETAEAPAHKQAESLLLGTNTNAGSENSFDLRAGNSDTAVVPVSTTSLGASSPESQFLKNAGADKADPTVRRELTEQKIIKQQEQEEASWWNIMSTQPDKKDPMVDAKKEKERIQENKKTGKPVNEGETPEVKGRDTGILGRIFGY